MRESYKAIAEETNTTNRGCGLDPLPQGVGSCGRNAVPGAIDKGVVPRLRSSLVLLALNRLGIDQLPLVEIAAEPLACFSMRSPTRLTWAMAVPYLRAGAECQ